MSTPTIHKHDSPQTSILPLLSGHLPHSGPLFRRIQHSLIYPSKTAQILATFPPALTSTSVNLFSPWLVAYVDVYVGSETQIWLYSSEEAKASLPTIQQRSGTEKQSPVTDELSKLVLDPLTATEVQAQLLSLCSYIRKNLIPPYISYLDSRSNGYSQPPSPIPQTPFIGKSVKKIPPHPPASFKIGTLHTGIYDLLRTTMVAPEKSPPHLPKIRILPHDTGICMKYLFHRSTYDPTWEMPNGAPYTNNNNKIHNSNNNGLPPGYRFHDLNRRRGVQSQHLDLVISRTDIPRSKNLLGKMPSVAVYLDGCSDNMSNSCSDARVNESSGCAMGEMPVAWAFLGLDGSLCTLHVEEEHRSRGLAKVIGREVMKLGMGDYRGVFTPGSRSDGGTMARANDDDKGWAFADVTLQNKASRSVMGKIGGEPAWTVKWVVVEVVED